ncbi:SDR family NAD(P)-dependent oxidoreductase [Planctomicrobium sp. SH664]|uniref:SDR family NAD(P)-dependent oxidoreductase n=1 Tax=Planctomicrobium sp. SH664 TaxID=3448125 RepID=UPI003F5B3C3B
MPEVVLITGASAGIGLELARRFAVDGSELILVARREERLRELAEELQQKYQTQSTVICLDLSEPSAPARLFEMIQASGKQVDVLVNNAGFGQSGNFFDISLERQVQMVQLNVSALMQLSHLFVKGMIDRRRGTILNLGSTAAFQPGPSNTVYFATKAFVLSFSEALAEELEGTGVTVTCLCPGPTKTEFADAAGMSESLVFKLNTMQLADVVETGYRGMRRRKRIVMPGLLNRLLCFSLRLTPRCLVTRLMHRIGKSRLH